MAVILNYVKSQIYWKPYQVVMYLVGCVLFSVGAKLFIDSDLGVDPLDVLVIGINKHVHLGMGICSAMIAVGFLSWWTLWNRLVPPITPFVTTTLVGFLIDLWNLIGLDEYTSYVVSPVPMLVIGLVICAYGSALIIMSGIGIRIMDLIAITMIEKWGWSFFRAKMALEIGLFSAGWLLGGPLGITTITFLFVVGPFIQPFMWLNATFLNMPNHGIKETSRSNAPRESKAKTTDEVAHMRDMPAVSKSAVLLEEPNT